MRVLHLTRDYPPRLNGGLSVAVPSLVEAGASVGVNSLVASFDAWRPRGRARAEPLAREPGVVRLRGPDDLPALRERAASFEPDLVHVHDALLHEEARRVGAPVLFHAHVLQARMRALRGLPEPTQSERAQARALQEARWVIAPSRAAADAIGRDRVSVVPFSVPLPEETEDGDGSVLFVGRFVDVKGIGELFDAIGPVAARWPAARFVIAGGLPDNPRAERRWRARFERYATDEARLCTTFTGWRRREALAALYRRASVLVVPSWTETFGLALAEGMAHGLAIVATDVPAFRERVAHEREGLLVPARDAGALAEAILRLLRQPDERHRLGRAAREAAARRSGSIGGALRRAYDEALSRSS